MPIMDSKLFLKIILLQIIGFNALYDLHLQKLWHIKTLDFIVRK